MSEYSATVEMLTAIYDRLGEQIQVIIASKGGKVRPLQPGPRPRTAVEGLRRDRRQERHLSLVKRLLPGRGGNRNR